MATIVYIFPNFENCARCEKDLKDDKDNSLHLGRKSARIFVLGHYLFLVAHSFPRATLSENCSLLGTDNVREQTSVHIFAPNSGYCLFIKYSTSDNVILAFRLVHCISVTSHHTYVWPYMEIYTANVKLFVGRQVSSTNKEIRWAVYTRNYGQCRPSSNEKAI